MKPILSTLMALIVVMGATNVEAQHQNQGDNCLDSCYYGVGGSYTPAGHSPEAQFGGTVLYNSTSGTVKVLASVPASPSIECYDQGDGISGGQGGGLIKRKELKPLSETDTLPLDSCQQLANVDDQLHREGLYALDYDTIKHYIAHCYYMPGAYGMFDGAETDVDMIWGTGGPASVWDQFREWLKSVLYLRTDSTWYCADVNAIVRTFTRFNGHANWNGAEAVIRYIVQHQRCDSEWTAQISGLNWPWCDYNEWRDTMQDSLTEPRPDTTVPSIDSIGLSILRGLPEAVHSVPSASSPEEITGLSVTENPFTNATAIKFNLADYGLVTFQLYDLLGNAVTTNGIGQVLYPGEHEFDVDGSKLSPGTYIARVAFHDGDVESIMLVRK